ADEKSLERARTLREEINAAALHEDLGKPGETERSERRLSELLAELRRVEGLGVPDPDPTKKLERPFSPTIEEIQARLADERTLLLEYCLGAERSYLWTLSRKRFTAHVLPPRQALEDQSREIYGMLVARQAAAAGSVREMMARAEAEDDRFRAAGAALARTLLGPIDDLEQFERLVIVSDGMLNYIPFSVFPDRRGSGPGGDYSPLVLSHEIVRVPSLAAMAALAERAEKGGDSAAVSGARVAVLADPVFTADDPRVHLSGAAPSSPSEADRAVLAASLRGTGRSAARLPRLLASRQEAASIRAAARGAAVAVLTGFRVSRAAAEEMLGGGYDVVHLATHGILNDDYPALSGIITSLVDEEGAQQDGFLRAQDIYGLRVTAPVVVLSACETALGQLLHGEGITGLVHAFLHAGARTIVASKWRVDDVGTQPRKAAF